MTDQVDGDRTDATPAGRTPGKYIVYVMVGFGVVLFGFVLALAIRLDPAADRFHNQQPPTTHK